MKLTKKEWINACLSVNKDLSYEFSGSEIWLYVSLKLLQRMILQIEYSLFSQWHSRIINSTAVKQQLSLNTH